MSRIKSTIVFTNKRQGLRSKPSGSKIGRLAQLKNRQSIAAPYNGRSSDTG